MNLPCYQLPSIPQSYHAPWLSNVAAAYQARCNPVQASYIVRALILCSRLDHIILSLSHSRFTVLILRYPKYILLYDPRRYSESRVLL